MVRPALALIAAAGLFVAAGPEHDHNHHHPAKSSAAQPQLDLLKSLAGQWTGTARMSETGEDEGELMEDVKVSYRVTGAGSAVAETIFIGTPFEMLTVYHLDGDRLMLTHYCAAGNQPRMKAEPAAGAIEPGKPATLKFVCTGNGTNMASEADMHMHQATFEVIDADHIRSSWRAADHGQPSHKAVLDLRRKKE